MAAFLPEPPHDHTARTRIGALLLNLGTPDEATPAAVRRYLAEFLSDARVVEIPAAVWKPILHGVILRVRPAQSARKYAKIWGKDGSPLLVHSIRQRALVTGLAGERLKALGLPADFIAVEVGMRYGSPSVASALGRLRAAGCARIVVVPLYPQYAASATASAMDAVFATTMRMRRVPALRTVDAFHDDPGYIAALTSCVNDYWVRHGRPDHLVLSFHGVPRRSLDLGDPYFCQCQKTGCLLGDALGLESRQYTVSFQSRFGRAEWLQPYTAPTLEALGKAGTRRVDVFCPGFVSDCLETLEEIGMEVRDGFLAAGGREYHAIPCLNEHPRWIEALTDIVLRTAGDWLVPPPDAAALEARLARARALGASR